MIETLLSIGALALLFALFGLLKPRAGCGSNCGLCQRSCKTQSSNDDHA